MGYLNKGNSRVASIKEYTAATPAEGGDIELQLPSIKRDTTTPAKSGDIESQSPGHPCLSNLLEWLQVGAIVAAVFSIPIILYAVLFTVIIHDERDNHLIKSHLPAIRIRRLDVGKVGVVAADVGAVVAVTVSLAVSLEASNGKEKTELLYRDMNATVAASGFQFGGVMRLADVQQPPENSTTLVVAAAMKEAVMDGRTASDLRSKVEAHVLMIDVSLNGWIDMKIQGEKMHTFPFGVECRSINQSVIDAGRAPKCKNTVIKE